MELTKIDPDKNIMQHNVLTTARYDFKSCQLDIMFMVLASLNKNDDASKSYNIRVNDIELLTGRTWNYQRLRDSTENMLSRVYEIDVNGLGMKQFVLFSYVQYIDGEGSFDIKINPDAREYFFDLKNNFTVLQLKSILTCTSKYAKRLYALSCQWRTTGGITYDISELKIMLDLKDPKGKKKEKYTEITMFKKYVLDIAKQQINKHTDITFDYKLIKKGRSYDKIKIFAGSSIPKQIEIDFKEDLTLQKHIRTIEAYGVAHRYAEIIAKKDYKEFLKVVEILKKDVSKGRKKINDAGAYLVGVFKNKGVIY